MGTIFTIYFNTLLNTCLTFSFRFFFVNLVSIFRLIIKLAYYCSSKLEVIFVYSQEELYCLSWKNYLKIFTVPNLSGVLQHHWPVPALQCSLPSWNRDSRRFLSIWTGQVNIICTATGLCLVQPAKLEQGLKEVPVHLDWSGKYNQYCNTTGLCSSGAC
jgi:hypothetical protein